MARIRLVHWKAQEAERLLEELSAAGYHVDYDEKFVPGLFRSIKLAPPDAFVIDLSRLPSHGREVATAVRDSKATRHVPLVFVDGAPEKVEAMRALLPDAEYTDASRIRSALRRAMSHPPETPVRPLPMMERYADRTAAQKLGIVEDTRVALIDAPRDYAKAIGALPKGAVLLEEAKGHCQVTLWFVQDVEGYLAALPRMRSLAGRTKLWILWQKAAARKGQPFSQQTMTPQLLREAAIAVGLVDYKVCSVNERWSALAFAEKKAR